MNRANRKKGVAVNIVVLTHRPVKLKLCGLDHCKQQQQQTKDTAARIITAQPRSLCKKCTKVQNTCYIPNSASRFTRQAVPLCNTQVT